MANDSAPAFAGVAASNGDGIERKEPTINKSTAESWMIREIAAINRVLKAHSTGAVTHPGGEWALIAKSSHISYRVKIRPDKKISGIEAIGNELNEAVSRTRKAPTKVRFSYMPFSIEVPYPHRRPLRFANAKIDIDPHSMIVGRSYSHNDGAQEKIISFDDAPHILIVGETGAGKSVLQAAMLLSLCWNTSPDDLRLILIDLKNEDLTPFARLPHVELFAGKPDDAMRAIELTYEEMVRRIDNPESNQFRLVLAIDELARLASNSDARRLMGEIGGVGRSKSVNLIGATQHPTKDGGLGAMMKANLPLRLVGMVTPGLSHIATGQAKAGADLLPGSGSFLWCKNKDVVRFQSYYITQKEIESMVDKIIDKWSGSSRFKGGSGLVQAGSEVVQERLSDDPEPVQSVVNQFIPLKNGENRQDQEGINWLTGLEFPIDEKRELTEPEKQELIRQAKLGKFDYNGSISFNRACRFAYGIKEPFRFEHIKSILENI